MPAAAGRAKPLQPPREPAREPHQPLALGQQNWLFAGSLRRGKLAVAVMTLIHSAKLNGPEPYAYLRDVPQRWSPPA